MYKIDDKVIVKPNDKHKLNIYGKIGIITDIVGGILDTRYNFIHVYQVSYMTDTSTFQIVFVNEKEIEFYTKNSQLLEGIIE